MRRVVVVAEVFRGGALGGAVEDPHALWRRPGTVVLKDHRRTAVARVTVGDTTVYVKQFKVYAWYRSLESRLLRSPARRAWEGAVWLEQRGFATPRLVGLVEDGGESWLVAEAVAGGVPGADAWFAASPGRRHVLATEAARTLRRFHDAGLYGRDTNANNFLVRARDGTGPEIVFLELENLRRPGRVGRRRRIKNLVQVYRMFRERIPRSAVLRFLHAYLGTSPGRRPAADRTKVRSWLRTLARVDLRKEREYRRRAKRRPAEIPTRLVG